MGKGDEGRGTEKKKKSGRKRKKEGGKKLQKNLRLKFQAFMCCGRGRHVRNSKGQMRPRKTDSSLRPRGKIKIKIRGGGKGSKAKQNKRVF